MLNYLRRSTAAQFFVAAIVVAGPSVYLIATNPVAAAPQPPATTQPAAQAAQVKVHAAKVNPVVRAKTWLYRALGRPVPRQAEAA